MVAEIKTAVNPYPIFRHGNVVLRIYWPVSRLGHVFTCRVGHFESCVVVVNVTAVLAAFFESYGVVELGLYRTT